jgi:hypothetical protein
MEECAASGAACHYGFNGPNGERQCSYCGKPERECANPDCDWKGHTDRYLGSIGPLCPECGEVTE